MTTAEAASPSLDQARLPPEVTARLLADGRRISRRLARRLLEEIALPPEFRQLPYLRAVVGASRDGLTTLLQMLHDGRRPEAAELAGLGLAGSLQAELGVPLEVLLSGYRLAAKVVWREVVDTATRLGELPPETVVALSEQVLEYLDDISGAVGSAYLETRERLVRQRDRERDRLLLRLLAGDTSPELRRLAATADLELTPPYRVLALSTSPAVDADRVLSSAWRQAKALVVGVEPGTWIALVAPGADIVALHRAAQRHAPRLVFGVGPVAATLADVAGAARRARQALAAGPRLRPGEPIYDEREIGVFAALLADTDALSSYVDHALGPLLGGDSHRHRALLRTLEVVLTTRGLSEAARDLGVHRHTVVYRLERISDMLGADLDDPLTRHRLWLAIEAARLLVPAATPATSR
ncbi:MAG TPA: helix-turn-helix domain-containing protein [Candidatus Dormibacteraeota bacterium]|jgi:hypothetical protein|nr:helix-turn-helix domain-containing protein [Candidatus Dormibacteraeota bacterium]